MGREGGARCRRLGQLSFRSVEMIFSETERWGAPSFRAGRAG
jgi:hypothetical protein